MPHQSRLLFLLPLSLSGDAETAPDRDRWIGGGGAGERTPDLRIAKATGGNAGDFLTAFDAMRLDAIGRTIEASPVAVALLEFLEERSDRYREYTVKEFFEALYHPQEAKAWPKSPKAFADALRRAAPALQTFGVRRRGFHPDLGLEPPAHLAPRVCKILCARHSMRTWRSYATYQEWTCPALVDG